MVTRKLIFLVISFLTLTGASSLPRKFPTVDGPEATYLISKTQGYLVLQDMTHEERKIKSGFKIISLPELREEKLKMPLKFFSSSGINYVSGPDEMGRIVYTTGGRSSPKSEKYDLVLTSLSGEKHEIIFSESGSVLDKLAGQRSMALSPKNGHLAVVRKTDSGVSLMQIWDIGDRRILVEFLAGYISAMPWFPDGQKIAYSMDVDHREIPGFDSYSEGRRTVYVKKKFWPEVTSVVIYDLSNNTHTFFHTGFSPIVSSDGKSLLIKDFGWGDRSVWYWVDVESKKSRLIDWPGRAGEVISFAGPHTILYRGLPTTGRKVQIVVDSPLWGRKLLLDIKLADWSTQEFQTVIESVHPYDAISYGQVRNTERNSLEQVST